ncbi:DUF2971 domain-containing protein [Acinetobacter sp. WCHAc060007]|uniref:DUF2971 domain-containing protein n=1 Tax=Acinetobacter sp. WCHAc060007 TaxID=2419605 RepID=UPI00148DF3BA|nr:DUF2971 domain-containing protein [Acinetobacter sp. WCHAc060007]
MIKDDQLYASPSHKLNDPCEVLFEHELVKNKINDFAKLITPPPITESLLHQLDIVCESTKNKTGIYSLSKNNLDELLWAYYANSHKGFCIGYDLDKLKNGLNSIGHMGEINYSNGFPSIEMCDLHNRVDLLNKMAFTKSKRWQHEGEFRILFNKHGCIEYDYRAVESIYFGLNMPETLGDQQYNTLVSQDCVMKAMQGRGVNYYKITLMKNSYELDAVKVQDKYPSDQKYKYSIKEIDLTLIDYNTYGWDVPQRIFDKAAEIVRRDPYFKNLNSIHLSKEKSGEYEKPVIFAGYFKDEECCEPVNLFFTIQDIEDRYSQIQDI